MQSIFCLQGNKPIPEDLWTLKLENCSLRMPEGKQQSQTVAAAHNNNTYRDRLYLKNTATKAKEFQLSTAGLLFQTFINSLFVERYCCLSNVLEYAANSLKKNHHKFRLSTTIIVDSQQTEPQLHKPLRLLPFSFVFTKQPHSSLPRTEQITAEESTIQRKVWRSKI